jgi:hypothetical protein
MMVDVKYAFKGSQGENIKVWRNHDRWNDPDSGVFFDVKGNVAWAVSEIPNVIQALQSVYDDFEAHKPDPNAELLANMEKAKAGSTVNYNWDSKKRPAYVKVGKDKWVYVFDNIYSTTTYTGISLAGSGALEILVAY